MPRRRVITPCISIGRISVGGLIDVRWLRPPRARMGNAFVRYHSRTLGHQAVKVLSLVDNQIQRCAVIKTHTSHPFKVQLFEGQELARCVDPPVDFQDDLHTHPPPATTFIPFHPYRLVAVTRHVYCASGAGVLSVDAPVIGSSRLEATLRPSHGAILPAGGIDRISLKKIHEISHGLCSRKVC